MPATPTAGTEVSMRPRGAAVRSALAVLALCLLAAAAPRATAGESPREVTVTYVTNSAIYLDAGRADPDVFDLRGTRAS